MQRQLLSAIFLSSLILSSLLSLPGEFRVADATAIVYIRADGSVDPSTAPIQRVQYVYTFFGDVNASLVVQRDGIVVDGAGHVLTGAGNGAGVDLSGRTNVTVQNLVIAGFENGVYMSFSSNNTLSGNNITGNTDYGVNTDMLNGCSGNLIVNNNVTGNGAVGGGGGVSGGGVMLNYASSNTSLVNNHVAENIGFGVCTIGSANNLIVGNTVTANTGIGVYLSGLNATLRNNSMSRNLYNFGIELGGSCDVDVSNTVEGRPVYYWVDKHGVAVPSDAGYVALVNCSDITVRNLNLTNNMQGVALLNTENCTITQNNIANNECALMIRTSSNNNSITYNNMTDNSEVITLDNSAFTTMCYNNITNNGLLPSLLDIGGGTSDNLICYNNMIYSKIELWDSPNSVISYNNMLWAGISVGASSNITISYNNVTNCTYDGVGIYLNSVYNSVLSHNDIEADNTGLLLSSSSSSNISYNTIADNSFYGLQLFSSSSDIVSNNDIIGNRHGIMIILATNNVFSHNKFINNTSSVVTASAGANSWDFGYPLGGNYWSDYHGTDVHSGPSQNGTGGDGLGDTAYVIDSKNIDNYPLMKPYAGPHDLGISVSVSKTAVPEAYNRTISMNVTVINYGVQAETFNFTSQTGSALQEQTVTLMLRNFTLFVFSFNVTGWSKGNYTLYCQASPVPGETDTSDNAYQGLFVVSILGDINGDCKVDMKDVGYVARRFQIGPTSPLWNPNADINDDLKIDMKDIGTVARHFGESWL